MAASMLLHVVTSLMLMTSLWREVECQQCSTNAKAGYKLVAINAPATQIGSLIYDISQEDCFNLCCDNMKSQGCNTAVRFNYNNQMVCLLVKCDPVSECKWERTPTEPFNVAALLSQVTVVDGNTEAVTAIPEGTTEGITQAMEVTTQIPQIGQEDKTTAQAPSTAGQVPSNVAQGVGGVDQVPAIGQVNANNSYGNVADPFAVPQQPVPVQQTTQSGNPESPTTTGVTSQNFNPIVESPSIPFANPAAPATQEQKPASQGSSDQFAQPAQQQLSTQGLNDQFAQPAQQQPASQGSNDQFAQPAQQQPATQSSNDQFAQPAQQQPATQGSNDQFVQPAQAPFNTQTNIFANPAVPNPGVPSSPPVNPGESVLPNNYESNNPFGSNPPVNPQPVQNQPLTDIWGRPVQQQVNLEATTEPFTVEATTYYYDDDEDEDEWMTDAEWDEWLKEQEAAWNANPDGYEDSSEEDGDEDDNDDFYEDNEADDQNYNYKNNDIFQGNQLPAQYPGVVSSPGTGTKLQSANVHRPEQTGSSFLYPKEFISSTKATRPIIIAGLCSLVVMVVLVLFFIARKMCKDKDRSRYRPLRDDGFSDHAYHDHPVVTDDPEWK